MNIFKTTTDALQPRNDILICLRGAKKLVVKAGGREHTGPVTITESNGVVTFEFEEPARPQGVERDAVPASDVEPVGKWETSDIAPRPTPSKRKRGRPRKT